MLNYVTNHANIVTLPYLPVYNQQIPNSFPPFCTIFNSIWLLSPSFTFTWSSNPLRRAARLGSLTRRPNNRTDEPEGIIWSLLIPLDVRLLLGQIDCPSLPPCNACVLYPSIHPPANPPSLNRINQPAANWLTRKHQPGQMPLACMQIEDVHSCRDTCFPDSFMWVFF